jgi:hypothetical protein
MSAEMNEVTAWRLDAHAHGWPILPNLNKMCVLKGWPEVVATTELITRRWARMRAYQATGMRIEHGSAAIDVDINNPIAEKIHAAMKARIESWGIDPTKLLIRKGKGHKIALFCQTEEIFSRLHSRRWRAPGASSEDETHAIEIFGGGSPRQFGVQGPHSHNPDGSVAVSYSWEGPSPAEVPVTDLPKLTKAQFAELVDLVEQMLREAGFEPVERSTKGEGDAARAYDIADGVEGNVFELLDGRQLSLADLEAAAATEEGLRCSASWLEGPTAKNKTRCIIGRSRRGHLTIWDSSTGLTHMNASLQPPDTAAEMGRIAEKLAKLSEAQRSKLSTSDDVGVTATKLLGLHALCPTESKCVVPIVGTAPEGMTLANFRASMEQYGKFGERGPLGGAPKLINPADIWLRDERRLTVAGSRMRPDKARPTFVEEDGKLFINTYRPPVHAAAPEGLDVFLALVAHLMPDLDEREWYLDWQAHKRQHPAVPGPGVVMVAKQQGAGRGTLFSIVTALFGQDYVGKVDPATLTGDGGQSQYNTWMANSVVVLVDEMFNAGVGAHLWQRQKVYDKLKGLIDPASRRVEIILKGAQNYVTQTYASFLIATNNANALPLDEDDRRICVLTNGGKLADNPALAQRLNRYREGDGFKAGFIAAVDAFLRERKLDSFNPYAPPPMFEGKRRMIEINMTDAGAAADDAIEEMPGDFVTLGAFLAHVSRRLDNPHEHKGWKGEARARLDRSGWILLGRTNVDARYSKAHVWGRDAAAQVKWVETPLAERRALLAANDDPLGGRGAALSEVKRRGLRVVGKTPLAEVTT